ncbi:DnaD domain-containing protein [Desertibacillus haloalkaliphilus]|uniref:DnaD domain-containing protein n=1 Tax=Desertibacillus haloalkaliphilus TaxID=1328930 RepID=UPI001C26D281|nr:DnaD domain-containing protein [Desertibacillus haloalkaliphilus]MBU8907288.1 DnaD domain-containing protein [Desertibacillus haloalkaliphilus]
MSNKIMVQWMAAGHLSISKMLLQYYTKLGINEEELVLLLHVQAFIEDGHSFPTPHDISERMSLTEMECAEKLRLLVKKGYLDLLEQQDDHQLLSESYSLEPLWEKLISMLRSHEGEATDKKKQDEEINLFQLFEKEFSRPLSPIECETLSMWLDQDQHEAILIKAALKEAVVSGKLNFRYIDRILFEWKKNGIRTVEQAKAYGEKFRKNQGKRYQQPERVQPNTFPTYNWLEQ